MSDGWVWLTSGMLSVRSIGEYRASSSASSPSLSSSASVLSATGRSLLDFRDKVFFQVFFVQIPTAFFA